LKELGILVESLLEHARYMRYDYQKFLELIISCRSVDVSSSLRLRCTDGRFMLILRRIVDLLEKAADTLYLMEAKIKSLLREGYKPFLVDCLGLAETYGIYAVVSNICANVSVVIQPYVNMFATTEHFRSKYCATSLAEVAKSFGASLYQQSTDKLIHEELGKPQKVENIVAKAKALLLPVIVRIAKDAVGFGKVFIASDHGYDVTCTPDGECCFEHKHQSLLARIAPLIIINCVSLTSPT